jgi:hypothetical protein
MTRYYDTIAEYNIGGYDIIVDKTYEDLNPRDMFDDSVSDVDEIIKDIDRGHLEWFMLRVRVLVEGLELGSSYLGGCLYENPREVITDGTADDLLDEAMTEARSQVYRLYKKFQELSFNIDAEGINV